MSYKIIIQMPGHEVEGHFVLLQFDPNKNNQACNGIMQVIITSFENKVS